MKEEQRQNYQDSDVILVRHAQSTYNEATIVKAGELGLSGVWDDFIKSDTFNKMVTYNQLYIDAPLSQHGRHQCENAQEELKDKKIDLILVSPQIRALETCKRIFGERDIPVVIEPSIMEVFRYSCDVSASIETKKELFPEYNFSKIEELGQEWYLEMLPEETKQLVLKEFQEREISSMEDKQKLVLELLSTKTISEQHKNLRMRAARIKQILKEYKQKYPVIVIVAHYYTIEFIKSTGFKQDDNLQKYQGIINCYPYYEKLEELLKVE